MKPSFLYRFLKVYCSIGLRFYYHTWQVNGREKVPAKGPLIYIANHQNAFIDAVLMTCSASRNPFSLARANVFQKPWAAKILTSLRLMPIYRFRDGFSTLKNNDTVMQRCVDLMKAGEVILLFPEGNHNEAWSMREYQKGFARLAWMYFTQTNNTNLNIVPVGIHYTEHHGFNKRVLINFGDPISISEIVTKNLSERENLDILVQIGSAAVKKLALDIKPEGEYDQRKKFLISNRLFKRDLLDQLRADQEILNCYPIAQNHHVKKSTVGNTISKIIFPYVFLSHAPAYYWIKNLIQKKIKDSQFISSVKYALGIFITPVYYIVLTLLFYAITQNGFWSIIFFISLPVSLLVFTKLKEVV